MPEELKDLIEKIQRDGVQAAEEKARVIEAEAGKEAEKILSQAKKDAQSLIQEAKKEAESAKKSAQAALVQAGRDTVIALKKEINDLLVRIATERVNAALKGDSLAEIIKSTIKAGTKDGKIDIVIDLKKEDLERIEKSLFKELSDEVKKGITLRSSDEVQAGFLISYDGGRSHFDLTDKALASYIALSLKPRLSEILNKVV